MNIYKFEDEDKDTLAIKALLIKEENDPEYIEALKYIKGKMA